MKKIIAALVAAAGVTATFAGTASATDVAIVTPTMSGPIQQAWLHDGGIANLGSATSPEVPVPGVPGATEQHFQLGTAYQSPSTGAHYLTGAINARYDANGGAAHYGLPVRNNSRIYPGYVNYLRGASIYWTSSTGAHAVQGGIKARFDSIGGINSYLGFPRSEEIRTATGSYVNFQRGAIVWNRSTGAIRVLT